MEQKKQTLSFGQWIKDNGFQLWYKEEPLYIRNAEDYSTDHLIAMWLKDANQYRTHTVAPSETKTACACKYSSYNAMTDRCTVCGKLYYKEQVTPVAELEEYPEWKEFEEYFNALSKHPMDAGHTWIAFIDKWRAFKGKIQQLLHPTTTVAPVAEGEGFDYPAAARAIALWLKEYCNEELPYPEMIADAARKVKQDRDNWVEMWRTSCDEIKFYKRFVEKERKVTKESLQLRQQLASLQAENAELRKKNDWLLNRR